MNINQGNIKKITVIGGGPAGMAAAIIAARQGHSEVRIIDKNDFLGRKLLATGNGRCNLTNLNCENLQDTLHFFSELGLLTRSEAEGRVYPYSEQATAVQEALINALSDLEVEILCGIEVKTIEKVDSEFVISNDRKLFYSDAVILATGGKAGPQYGSTGDGYRFAKSFGHSVIRPMPSLVQMVSDQSFFKALKGVRAKGQAILIRKNQPINRELGEIQFTEDGLSGICIFNISKYYVPGDRIRLDLMPEYSDAEVKDLFESRRKALETRKLIEFLNGTIHKKLIPVILDELSLEKTRKIGSLNSFEIEKLVSHLKSWEISITGTKGWKEAQVTAGGIDLDEINLDTMESKLVSNLFFAGEVLNVDERCGGYNLQWAWSSGMIAGKAAASAIKE